MQLSDRLFLLFLVCVINNRLRNQLLEEANEPFVRELVHIVQLYYVICDEVKLGGALADWLIQLAGCHQQLHGSIDLHQCFTRLLRDGAAFKEFLDQVLALDEHLLRLLLLELLQNFIFNNLQSLDPHERLAPVDALFSILFGLQL